MLLRVHHSNDAIPIPPHRWVPEVRHFGPNTPIIVCGNMSDLRTNEHTITRNAARGVPFVSHDDAKALGKEIGAEMVLECSACTGEGLKELYRHAAEVGLRGRAQRGFGYQRTSRSDETCKTCAKSKKTCDCERRLIEVRLTNGCVGGALDSLSLSHTHTLCSANNNTYAHSYM